MQEILNRLQGPMEVEDPTPPILRATDLWSTTFVRLSDSGFFNLFGCANKPKRRKKNPPLAFIFQRLNKLISIMASSCPDVWSVQNIFQVN